MNQTKIPIKVAEISINKFNEQIFQKVTQLRTFRISQSNTTSLSDLEKLRKDAINCLRVVKQLKQLLIEIDHLKSQTREEDHEKFDELTSRRRQDALKEIQLYQDMKPIDKLNELSHHATTNIDNEMPAIDTKKENIHIQLQVDDREIRKRELESREALLREFENLQTECESIANLFQNVSELVAEQAPMVDKIEENVEETEHNVEEGTKHLQQALSYKKTMYPLLGGLVGAAMLGPVGLIAGLKAGSAATLCGGICGYAGGKILKKANTPTESLIPNSDEINDTHKMSKEQQSEDNLKALS
ncbi:hypothetical protein PVAND_006819 [Polypedilum vanderplanki]|uniref:t-SNARE coiled-coil homology domain-containing protein n=1 Tax=Polypedilum vanderplanki TaxID=319348 RepID=A0A9J6C5A7_POLVA|nr:hypothetical protein PVAND_006819 [Polypedilum vanderplanki]